jgi:hypothetical protein
MTEQVNDKTEKSLTDPFDLGRQGVSQSQPVEVLPMTEEDFIKMVVNARPTTEEVIAYLTDELSEYEKKYKMRSEVFYDRYNRMAGTPECDQPDFIAWAICYRSFLRVTRLSS